MQVDTEEDWIRHYRQAWEEVRRRCVGCSDLLGWLEHGWGLPLEDNPKGSAWRAERARWRYLRNRGRAGRFPTVEEDGEERPLQVDDNREVWEQAGVPDHVLEDKFASAPARRPRLHPELTPEVLDDVLSSLQAALSHLYDVPTADLEAHFTDAYGRPWPPHLEEVHRLLVDEWTRGDRDLSAAEREKRKGRATARRVAMELPIETKLTYAEGEGASRGPVADVTYRDCPFSYEQIRGLDRAKS